MGKIFIIIQREYITRVRRKSFLITTLLAPLGFFLLIASSVLISTFSQGKTHVAIVDESGLFKDIPIPDADDQSVYFHRVTENYDDLLSEVTKEESAKYEALIFIPADFNVNTPNNPAIAYRYVKRPGMIKQQFINQRMTDVLQKLRMKMLQVDEQQIEDMQQKVKLNFESLDNSKEKQGYTDAAAIVGMVMGFAIYISLFFYGTMIMKGVMEEKSNRIVEVLTSSVQPFQLLMGKILGVGAVGLTQFVLWIILMFGVNLFSGVLFGIAMGSGAGMGELKNSGLDADDLLIVTQNLSALPIAQIVILFPLYFLGGFFLYGSLFAAVGAAMGEDGDQQSLMVPITIPIIISIFIAINVINNPDSSLGFWGSIIPFTSPIVMCALLPFRPEWWQILLSIVLLIGGFVLTTYVAAKIYRVGILMYGKKIKMSELVRWIFSKG
ncbi:MAG: ABC transporter permease [Chitinophagales bacterium]|nr:ABC transporter permease [Chitinophagales bacterium]